MIEGGLSLFGRMAAVADVLRSRILLVLERHELTVGELCSVFQVPQSTMSRQLKVLGDEQWVHARAEGARRRYRMMPERLDEASRSVWGVVRAEVEQMTAARQDRERVESVLAERRQTSRDFFSAAATEWDRLRAELYGRRLDHFALLGLLADDWVVGDLGCGTGQVSVSLAPFVRRVIGVDESPEMLDAARERIAAWPGVELREGRLEDLPVADGELNAAVISLVLHYVADPGAAIREVGRALAPGGRLLVVDMAPHDREEYRQAMGHRWQGFSREQVSEWTRLAGLESFRWTSLPADPDARGPGLFVATARRAG